MFLVKGLPVVYMMHSSFEKELQKRNISYINKGVEGLEINCFVAGDTKEKGLSIIALDDPTLCVLEAGKKYPHIDRVREYIKEHKKVPLNFLSIIDLRPYLCTDRPECPYSE